MFAFIYESSKRERLRINVLLHYFMLDLAFPIELKMKVNQFEVIAWISHDISIDIMQAKKKNANERAK